MSKYSLIMNSKFHDEFHNEHINIQTPIDYILNPTEAINQAVYNLSSDMGYQDLGYYVSLLALARKEKIYPSPITIQDLKDRSIQKLYSEETFELIQSKLNKITADSFELTVYFGSNINKKYESLAWDFYRIIQAPLFKVIFKKEKKWQVSRITLINIEDLNQDHRDFLKNRIQVFFTKPKLFTNSKVKYQFDIAILINPEEESPPSDTKAIKLFVEAFKKEGIKPYLIQEKEKANIGEYDALFIRETTNVSHYTYRIARKAEKEGLVVIDDPDSIVKCTNKVFLEQLMDKINIKRPTSFVLDHKMFKQKYKELSYPCVIKEPDSAFSQGVYKAKDEAQLLKIADKVFKKTHLILIQEFLPTDFDWRIGILNNEVIYACKYYMAAGHWQIINNAKKEKGNAEEGGFECLKLEDVPSQVIKTALKISKSIGNGLYGIDLKQKDEDIYFIEINDNPSIEAGIEDQVLGKELYFKIAKYFLKQCQLKRGFIYE